MRYWKRQPIVIPGGTVEIIIATFDQEIALKGLMQALKLQTYRDWSARIVHDGEWGYEPLFGTSRYWTYYTPKRENKFGHNCREYGRLKMNPGARWAMFTNGDNYYTPVFLEAMVSALQQQNADLAYCNVVHSHKLWMPMKTAMRRGQVDIGCWICRADWIRETPFDGREFASDWFYLEQILKRKPKLAKVDGYHMVHN